MERQLKPWPALWALVIGFFMILIDTTIVSVANPSIMKGLNLGTDYNAVIWVTSAYLLAYAVPLLITGRLGDRFGPKNMYLIGLVIFTLASAWCGFSGVMAGGGIGMLITARVVQGLGASLMTPQTMAVITRIFPPDRRGAAMGLWGAVAGVATLIGPLLGGVLVDWLGWEWIFFINVPVGVVAFILAVRLVPKLPTHTHAFDILGVVLSAVGMFLLVFGIQEGGTYNWGVIGDGPFSVWGLIIAGIVVLIAFVVWQALNKKEPLLPLPLFRDRNFSLSNGAITTVGFAVTCMALPLVFYFQTVRGLTPTQSALMLAPTAVFSGVLAPIMGRLIDKINPKFIATPGLVLFSLSLFLYSRMLTPDVSIWWLLIPSALMGIAMSGVWGPISAVTTRNLPMNQAGAGSGVFNTTRQIGAVLGSASISALITGRLAVDLPKAPSGAAPTATAGTELPSFLHAGFTQAMSEALLLPAAVAFLGALIVVWWAKPKPPAWGPRAEGAGRPAEAGQAGEPVAVGAVAGGGAEAAADDAAGAGVAAVAAAADPLEATGTAPAHGAHAASGPVDAARHGAHAAEPAADARRDGEEHHGIHAAPATD
ncbi:DHA2 family efflux MFS transporter permease subunit [Leifsonia shinshuensis]|uniref:EmrB/QacA subfamily drug resistance transporter n=3 Tax=Actinomycetes TaxID=1760 RepID=A0A853CP63_9MICO|nr:DHA2 family efflux MFS transporter permease subunit [Leifsonia shinshuensis]NYJ22447.1 EmrB/QacA subfamily drug resistance transporter [Leifsonia shinshuensis]